MVVRPAAIASCVLSLAACSQQSAASEDAEASPLRQQELRLDSSHACLHLEVCLGSDESLWDTAELPFCFDEVSELRPNHHMYRLGQGERRFVFGGSNSRYAPTRSHTFDFYVSTEDRGSDDAYFEGASSAMLFPTASEVVCVESSMLSLPRVWRVTYPQPGNYLLRFSTPRHIVVEYVGADDAS